MLRMCRADRAQSVLAFALLLPLAALRVVCLFVWAFFLVRGVAPFILRCVAVFAHTQQVIWPCGFGDVVIDGPYRETYCKTTWSAASSGGVYASELTYRIDRIVGREERVSRYVR